MTEKLRSAEVLEHSTIQQQQSSLPSWQRRNRLIRTAIRKVDFGADELERFQVYVVTR